MTFDIVTSSTGLDPTDGGYPFSDANFLIGQIYYVRLLQGSSNGLPMVSLQASSTSEILLQGFYTGADSREEFDAEARRCVERLSNGSATACPVGATTISRIQSRVFLDPGLNGSSRLVIFAKPEGGGNQSLRAGNIAFGRRNEAGTVVQSGNFNCNRIVNIFTISGTENGWINIVDFPTAFETYAFTFNSASPGFDPSLTWDAIFESFILPSP